MVSPSMTRTKPVTSLGPLPGGGAPPGGTRCAPTGTGPSPMLKHSTTSPSNRRRLSMDVLSSFLVTDQDSRPDDRYLLGVDVERPAGIAFQGRVLGCPGAVRRQRAASFVEFPPSH